ncbi:hypothetical protein NLG97_g1569 [Lecanicillium saksenae]|uniref:Uncharacterized protein n=1 Tax=Lecanicillium saksenae TaxID=468837 RepID=A0ACC1R623_9HYPO|nr:hypothetical protein NLG97_g1569 [Lecanicillium saksenae]
MASLALVAVGVECAAAAANNLLEYRHCPPPSCAHTTVTVTVTVTTTVASTNICTETPTSSSSMAPTTTFTSTTPTTASTKPTSTSTSCPIPPACGNLGFDWAYYNNLVRNTDRTYSGFHLDVLKKTKPLYIGTTPYVGGLYGFKLNYFTLNHVAYLYAYERGTYRISIPYANDAVYLWTGSKAYLGWTDADADAKALYNQPDHVAGSA